MPENKAVKDMLQAAFDSDKAREYASQADKAIRAELRLEKSAEWSRRTFADVDLCRKVWVALGLAKGFNVEGFKPHVATEAASSRKIAEAVLKWLSAMPAKTTAKQIAELGIEEIHAAIMANK